MLLKLQICFLFLVLPQLLECNPIDTELGSKSQKLDVPEKSNERSNEIELQLFQKLSSFSLSDELNLTYFTLWQRFKNQYKLHSIAKKYSSYEEEQQRFLNFVQNLHTINLHNLRHKLTLETYTMKINSYVDMSKEEIPKKMLGFKSKKLSTDLEAALKLNRTQFQASNNQDIPKSVDWREKGYVTPVKTQVTYEFGIRYDTIQAIPKFHRFQRYIDMSCPGQCGSCWAFSAVGALEGQTFKKTSKLVSLSEQQLVDCSSDEGDQGCNGGLMDNAFQYVMDNNGLDTNSSYPYVAKDQPCRFKNDTIGATVSDYVDIKQDSEHDLMVAVATVGPVSVAIQASDGFFAYGSGVLYDKSCSPDPYYHLNHGVLVVGYGTTEKGEDYWIVKNSWGKLWGEDGYVRMARNRNNNCGIASVASYPVV